MISRHSSCRLGLVVLFLLGTSLALSADETDRQKKLAEIEKQIADLNQKLDEIRKADAATPTVAGALPDAWVKQLRWRSIGPAAMGGRIVAISVFEDDPSTYWVATASGGLLKTINNGITFDHQFDREATVSIGDVCVAPSNRDIVWVGTGENNPRNSVSYGDGVYKSTDGGKTWKNMGLRKSFQTGRIIVHPKNPDVVYVGALGRLYGPNEERGLFKTTDGGKTWDKVLYVDDKTGCIDMAMHPTNPDTLIVAMWERKRDGFDSHRGEPPLVDGYDAYDPITKWGPGSGLYKTTDGGKTFKKLTNGLPSSPLGRIGLDYYRKNPDVLFAVVDCQKIAMGTPPSRVYFDVATEETKDGLKITRVTPESPANKAGLKVGEVLKSFDKKPLTKSDELIKLLRTRKSGEKVIVEVIRESKPVDVEITLEDRPLIAAGPQGRFAAAGLLGFLAEEVEGGLKVTRIFDERAAEKAGFQEDDVIKEVEGKPVTDLQSLTDVVRSRKEDEKLAFKVARGKEVKELSLKLESPEGGNRNRPYSYMYGGQAPNVQDQQGPNSHEYGGLFKSIDGGETWSRINSVNPRPMYFSNVKVDPSDEKYVYVLGVLLHRSKDGGKTFTDDGANAVHPDQHALWINPRDGRHMIVGCDGGFYVTHDRMERWDHLSHLAIGQFYHAAVDNRKPYRVFGGLQDNGSWGGPSRTLNGTGPINEDWFVVGSGDGFVCRVDPSDSDVVYHESQDGFMGRLDLGSMRRASIRPRAQKGMKFRFNWNTPFILSATNPRIFYCAGNYVFRSLDRGRDLTVISPHIARTGRGTATALAESPRNPEVLWVGTDDGNLWLTRDGGTNWTSLADKVGLPGPRWVSTIEPSRFADGRCYVAFDGHRSDDDAPILYVTEDFGETWKSLVANLPTGSTRCLREDVKNPDLLFTGTEFAVWASVNRGDSWAKINNNLPTVAVHDVAIHPTAGEMVAATHGRSLWVLDVTALRQMTTDTLKADAHLYEPNTVVRWRAEPMRGSPYGTGHRKFTGENPPPGAQVYYSLGKKADKLALKIVDYSGQTIRELSPKNEPGLHRVDWDLNRSSPRRGSRSGETATRAGAERAQARAPQGQRRSERGGDERMQPATVGVYRVVLTVDGKEYAQNIRVEADPKVPTTILAGDGDGQ
jgi:photosystem II stability/assembly factor-like uncharacterized protein